MSMENLYAASNQWARRPADERFWGIMDLRKSLESEQKRVAEMTVDLKDMKAVASGNQVKLLGKGGNPSRLTNWAFQQLATICGAPARFLRERTPNTTAINVNECLQELGEDDRKTKLLIRGDVIPKGGKDGKDAWKSDTMCIRALTGPDYGRIWHLDLVKSLTPALDGGWRVPPAMRANDDDDRARPAEKSDLLPGNGNFGYQVKEGDMIAPAGVYASDRDMFLFMVHPQRVIDDGNDNGLMRGFFLWNSETGAGAFKLTTFYLEAVCGNHIVWGAKDIQQLKIIHRKKAAQNFGPRMIDKLKIYAEQTSTKEQGLILAARQYELVPAKGKSDTELKNEIVDKLFGNKKLDLAKTHVQKAYDYAVEYEHTAKSPPNTAWGFVHGLTRYSQTFSHADERNKLDKAGGRLLDMAQIG